MTTAEGLVPSMESATGPQWALLLVLLPITGRAVAATWGARGALAAQRALLLLAVYVALSLLLAWPLHVVPFLLGALPVAGAALYQAPPTWRDRSIVWVGAAAMALPAASVSLLGPFLWASFWLVALFGAVAVRGLVEPVLDRWSR